MGTIKRTFANSLTGTGKLSATALDSNIPAANIADASVTNVTTLPESIGQAIKSVAGSPPSQAVGDIWYNSVTGTLKNYVTVAAAWAAGGNMVTARDRLAGLGTQTAALAVGGDTKPGNPPGVLTTTEEYDGSTWSSQTGKPVAIISAGAAGVQTAGVIFGGYNGGANSTSTEEYNGSSWSPGGAMGTARRSISGCGTQTASLGFGGFSTADTGATEEYDGSTWTAGGSRTTTTRDAGAAGTQTAGLGFGGYYSIANTEEYDGSTWTTGNNLNTARRALGGCGLQTAALAFGGALGVPLTGTTELYDGTSWTTSSASLSTARRNLGPAGTQSSALGFGGYTTASLTSTEEFTGAFNATRTVTTS